MQQEQLNVLFFFLKATLHFRLMVVNICSDGGGINPVLCICHVGRHSWQRRLRFCVFYRVTHEGDGQANRYFDFGRWFFSYRRRGGNGRGQ